MRAVAHTDAERALTQDTTETLLMVKAASGHAIRPTEVSVGLQGINNIGEPIIIELLRLTSDGTASAVTPVKVSDESDSISATASKTFTVEPSAGDILKRWVLHPAGGGVLWTNPDPEKFVVPGGGRIGLRVLDPTTGGDTVNANAYIEWDE